MEAKIRRKWSGMATCFATNQSEGLSLLQISSGDQILQKHIATTCLCSADCTTVVIKTEKTGQL